MNSWMPWAVLQIELVFQGGFDEFSAVQLEWHMDSRWVCVVSVSNSTRVTPLINGGGTAQMKWVFEEGPQTRPSCLQEDP